MFRSLLTRLFSDRPDPVPLRGEDAELAIAALMIRVARADDHYRSAERDQIDKVIARRRGLGPAEARERRETAEMIEAEAPDTVRFTRSIKDRIALDERLSVIAALWEIVYADGRRSPDEETMVRLVAGLLGVPDRDSALARQRVLDGMTPDRE
ncbi:tellurite resistance TerB family protein [Paracoccus jiaweipingae]|uniref:tellurite resistance TerB family protein n=1 Tax=unclassified Paracoccus (in: a-proteobacteria) TaxID=2688777 RepID=UPI00378B68BD